MPPQFTRADSLREFLTGVSSDGGSQSNPNLSLGHFYSSTEAVSYGITITNPLTGVSILYAGGGNPVGNGTLTAISTTQMTWQPAGAISPGPPTTFSGTNDVEIVEAANNAGQYLRVQASTPLTPGASTIGLAYLIDNVFGLDDIMPSDALAGIIEYRATMVRNVSSGTVQNLQRWIATLGTVQISDSIVLAASGTGTLATTGSFSTWPVSGWCQIQTSGSLIRELVYYTIRTATQLTVPASGRGLLGTIVAAGSFTDNIYPVPGIAIGIDPTGVQAFGTSIQTIANGLTTPVGVTWNLGITPATGLQIGSLSVSEQVGLWIKRQIPAGAMSGPQFLNQMADSFGAY